MNIMTNRLLNCLNLDSLCHMMEYLVQEVCREIMLAPEIGHTKYKKILDKEIKCKSGPFDESPLGEYTFLSPLNSVPKKRDK